MSPFPATASLICKKPSKPPPPATLTGCCSSWWAATPETATCTPPPSSTVTTRKRPSALEAANNEIVDAALGMGGTITGEHGVGTEKRRFMTKRFTPVEIAAQRAIKRVFDPAALLNPGIMLPDPSPDEPNVGAFETALRGALEHHRTATAVPATPVAPADQHRRETDHGQHREFEPGRRGPGHPRRSVPPPLRSRGELRSHPVRGNNAPSANSSPPPLALSVSPCDTACSVWRSSCTMAKPRPDSAAKT